MIKVGLTGNRYSGKDRIAKLFKQISIPVFDADTILKFILQYSLEQDKQIKIQLGSSVYDSSGHLDPSKFDTTEKFNRLIDIVEAEVFRVFEKFQEKNKHSIYCVFHSSIIFERDWHRKMDYNISVFTPKVDRIERAHKKEPLVFPSVIHNLIGKEIDDLEKNKLSNYVIHNYLDATDVVNQVDNIDQNIIDAFLKNEQTKTVEKKPSRKIVKYPKMYPL